MTVLANSASIAPVVVSAVAILPSRKNTRGLNTKKVNAVEERFGTFIDSKIVGQENGRRAARRAVRRTLSKLRVPNQPYYVIIAPGPTTSGKSETAYRLGEFFHGNRLAVLKIDCTEYMDKINLSHLTGASPNYAGFTNRQEKDYIPPKAHEKDAYAEFSQHNLTRSRMGSKSNVTVVLIDEWEKGCKEFNAILLSIFREGRYTLGNGEIVDFTNCIFVLTANIGSAEVEDAQNHRGIGFNSKNGCSAEEADEIINEHLRAFAPPEFRARVEENGEICIFHQLSTEQIASLCKLKIEELCSRVEKDAGITVNIDKAARDWLLAKSGTVAKLNGAVKTDIIDVLDNELLKGEIGKENVVHVLRDEESDELRFEVETPAIIMDLDPEELMQLMAEKDASLAAPRGAGKPDEVDQARVSSVASSELNAAPANGVETAEVIPVAQAVPMQPFRVQFMCPDRENLAKVRVKLYEEIEASAQAVVVSGDMRYVAPFIATFEVYATLEAIVALKAKYPLVAFLIVGGEVS